MGMVELPVLSLYCGFLFFVFQLCKASYRPNVHDSKKNSTPAIDIEGVLIIFQFTTWHILYTGLLERGKDIHAESHVWAPQWTFGRSVCITHSFKDFIDEILSLSFSWPLLPAHPHDYRMHSFYLCSAIEIAYTSVRFHLISARWLLPRCVAKAESESECQVNRFNYAISANITESLQYEFISCKSCDEKEWCIWWSNSVTDLAISNTLIMHLALQTFSSFTEAEW